jgi:K+-transporting ATPase ATPase C chain
MTIVLTVLLGLAYPLAMTGVAQTLFRSRADGSLVSRNGAVVGSGLIGQVFAAPRYFHPRPSAAGKGYDATSSAASNLGPTNPDLEKAVADRAQAYRTENGLADGTPVPVDAVTGSGSGLDPAISVANADDQAPRVAHARTMTVEQVLALIKSHTAGRGLGILGEPAVNVLELNLALDGAH